MLIPIKHSDTRKINSLSEENFLYFELIVDLHECRDYLYLNAIGVTRSLSLEMLSSNGVGFCITITTSAFALG